VIPGRQGFTLVEILIVVVIIGAVAAIAIPKFAAVKTRAYVAAMQSDLRLLVSAQESYFADNDGIYAIDVAKFGTSYQPSPGVSIQIHNVSASGYLGIAVHASTSTTCALQIGGGSSTEGTPVCQ
jgi:type IV pilus assembly protein PilA